MIGRLTGVVLLVTTAFTAVVEWHGGRVFALAAGLGVILFLALAVPRVGWSRRIFVIVALLLVAVALATRSDWPLLVEAALRSSAFIAAFFTALTCLRYASAASPAIAVCGRFLAEQPPGRRYAALTVGGHLFGLVLNYGAISLLGSLAEAHAAREPNAQIRTIRIRRMLLAIQRGFISTLCWSPLAFASAVSTALVPGASWADAALPCFVSGLLMAGLGWALDTIFKPAVIPGNRPQPSGSWWSLLPMLALLAILIVSLGSLHVLTGIRAVGVVMVIVPAIALIWLAMQNRGNPAPIPLIRHVANYTDELATYRPELVLLLMAGFIGTLGSRLLLPLATAAGFDLAALPGWLILVGLVWLIPLTGLMGMNPILSVSLIAPLLPHAETMGTTPTAIIVAITAGWALGGASSPYTATTLLIGLFAKVSAWRVGLSWNGLYTLICGVALSGWVLLFAWMAAP
jgi:hypothetical protein